VQLLLSNQQRRRLRDYLAASLLGCRRIAGDNKAADGILQTVRRYTELNAGCQKTTNMVGVTVRATAPVTFFLNFHNVFLFTKKRRRTIPAITRLYVAERSRFLWCVNRTVAEEIPICIQFCLLIIIFILVTDSLQKLVLIRLLVFGDRKIIQCTRFANSLTFFQRLENTLKFWSRFNALTMFYFNLNVFYIYANSGLVPLWRWKQLHPSKTIYHVTTHTICMLQAVYNISNIGGLGAKPPKFLAECQLPWLCGKRMCPSLSKFFLHCTLSFSASSIFLQTPSLNCTYTTLQLLYTVSQKKGPWCYRL